MSSQRLSVGMTPKTLRLPKPGEMLLSVRGSPLGVYKDDNMEAIHGIYLSLNEFLMSLFHDINLIQSTSVFYIPIGIKILSTYQTLIVAN